MLIDFDEDQTYTKQLKEIYAGFFSIFKLKNKKFYLYIGLMFLSTFSGAMYRIDGSSGLFLEILITCVLITINVFLFLLFGFTIFSAKLTQDAYYYWMRDIYFHRAFKKNSRLTSSSTPLWIIYSTYLVGILFFIIIGGGILLSMILLPDFFEQLGLTDKVTIIWLIGEIIPDSN